MIGPIRNSVNRRNVAPGETSGWTLRDLTHDLTHDQLAAIADHVLDDVETFWATHQAGGRRLQPSIAVARAGITNPNSVPARTLREADHDALDIQGDFDYVDTDAANQAWKAVKAVLNTLNAIEPYSPKPLDPGWVSAAVSSLIGTGFSHHETELAYIVDVLDDTNDPRMAATTAMFIDNKTCDALGDALTRAVDMLARVDQ